MAYREKKRYCRGCTTPSKTCPRNTTTTTTRGEIQSRRMAVQVRTEIFFSKPLPVYVRPAVHAYLATSRWRWSSSIPLRSPSETCPWNKCTRKSTKSTRRVFPTPDRRRCPLSVAACPRPTGYYHVWVTPPDPGRRTAPVLRSCFAHAKHRRRVFST